MDLKILVVDDEPNIVDILEENLSREGYTILKAYDGATALQIVLDEQPDLILLDCMLPRMDGFEVCKRIRQKSSVRNIIVSTKLQT